MLEGFDTTEYAELRRVIRSVRNRWRFRTALRGLAILLGGGLLTFLLFTFVIDQLRYSAGTIFAVRLLTVLALLGLSMVALAIGYQQLRVRYPAVRRIL